MAVYEDIFVITDVAKVHRLYVGVIEAAAREDKLRRGRGLPEVNVATLTRLRQAYREFNDGLLRIARLGSAQARQAIIDQIRITAKRSDTGVIPHLRDAIVCRAIPIAQVVSFASPVGALQSGAVGIADEEYLERVTDRNGYPYWRAQEFGTGGVVGSIVGHQLRGYFYGTGFSGQASPPGAAPSRTHPVFRPGPPTTGQKGLSAPVGVVAHEIEARHFIRDGAATAQRTWKREIDALQAQQLAVISSLN